MIVIADTSPINYLIQIGAIDVLPKLYGSVLSPPSVCDELRDARAPQRVRLWIAQPPEWFKARVSSRTPDLALLEADLDVGERDAILLAQELGADELIIDDMSGRREAERRHLQITGTVGVLQAAAEVGLLDLRTAFNRLRQTNFHIAQHVLDQIMKAREK